MILFESARALLFVRKTECENDHARPGQVVGRCQSAGFTHTALEGVTVNTYGRFFTDGHMW